MKWLANYIAAKLVDETNYNRPIEVVSYGLEVILNIACQFVILLIIGYTFNCVTTIMAASISAVVLRNLSGGGHCSNFHRCTFLSCTIFTLIGFFSQRICLNMEFIVSIYLIMLLLVIIWAPVSNRLWSYQKRIFFKISSSICLLALLLLSLHSKEELVVAVMLGLAWQTFTITPAGLLVISKIDSYLGLRKEVTEHV